jgi:hypothetical protein
MAPPATFQRLADGVAISHIFAGRSDLYTRGRRLSAPQIPIDAARDSLVLPTAGSEYGCYVPTNGVIFPITPTVDAFCSQKRKKTNAILSDPVQLHARNVG